MKTQIILILIISLVGAVGAETEIEEGDAVINVNSKPSGAEISINGTNNGVTPLKGIPLSPGTYAITGNLKGYKDIGIKLELEENGRSDINLEFAGKKGGGFSWRDFWIGAGGMLLIAAIIAVATTAGPS